ncbi:MAG: hypothetical protein AAF683_00120 [Pseudomonadota bacterium]
MTGVTTRKAGQQNVSIQCPECGSTNVVKDAAAAWDEDAQDWSLLSVYDSTTCQDCEYESDYRFKEVPIKTD